jgi:hypothetical protein
MELVNIQYAGEGVQPQDLSLKDKALVTSNFINSAFGAANDYLELYIYDQNGTLLEKDYDASDYYPFITNNPKNNTYSNLTLDPEKDLKNRGFVRGNLNIQYNFHTRLFNSAFGRFYWIKEISTSRTELKLASQVLSDISIRDGFDAYQSYIATKNYYPVFYLNFGDNQIVTANNVAYTEDAEGAYLLVKLYEPLPTNFEVKTQLWIVDKVAESVSFDVSIQVEAEEIQQVNRLRGPNYNVVLNNKNGQTTPYYNYNNLLASPVTSSFQKLLSYYQDKAIKINVDYSDFSNFIHFSSAVERVNNFVYKLQLIESSSAIIAEQQSIVNGGSIVSSSITAEQKAIDNIIKNFDTYEYFLYFESASWAWPKSTSTQPYSLYSVSSSEASNFLGGINIVPTPTTQSLLFSASYYDATNKDLLHNSVPQYLLDDPANQPYITFLDMIGQHFDNIWIYYKDVTNRYNATNNPNTGISLDMVSDALKGLGFQLYTNSNVSDNLYYTLFGINADGSLLPPTGSEMITNYVTSSLTTLPAETIQDELYKRLYHNLPYLLKSKGTARGVKALISTFGIPEEILTVREFGGNYTGSLDGIIDLNSSDYKVTIATGSGGNVTGSLTISSSLLSPYTTIQYYQGNTRLNSTNVEVGFSPADVINANISASQGIFSLDQLIGSPALQYSASYTPLVSASNAYFASYTQPNSVWEYIRLLKFYNNTLFKTIKDFVPARANISTGIIVKSHMYERNKYPRHEPSITFNDYFQSIELLEISADNGGALTGSTAWSGFVVTPLGLASYSSSQNQELYNGELDGTVITATDGLAMEQGDYISHITGAVNFYNYGALYQNISSSVKSQNLIDLDYTSDQLKPVNYGPVTQSLNGLNTDAYATYTNPNNPFAQVQDYNYNLKRSIIPRYSGSATVSATYNDYTLGDSSYGKTAAIDKIKTQYAYIVDIYSSSFQMPYRAKGQIKYLIDNDQNVLNLSKNNTNWFAVQNIFKAGEYADVSLFDYDPANPYINKLNNSDNDFTIWESGYSYSPLIYNPSGSLTYILYTPELVNIPGNDPVYTTINSSNADYWTFPNTRIENPGGIGNSIWLQITGSLLNSTTSTYSVTIRWYATFSSETYPQAAPTAYHTTIINANTTEPYTQRIYLGVTQGGTGYYDSWTNGSTSAVVTIIQEQALTTPASPAVNTYTTSSFETDTTWWLINNNQVKISLSQSAYYGDFISTGSYDGLEAFVFSFSASKNDLIRFYNVSTSRWDQSGEFRISDIDTSYDDNTGSYVLFTLDRDVSPEYTAAGSQYPSPIYKYLLLKKLQDETSIYFNYDLPQAIPQDGTLFPQYIGPGIKEESGNVIKSLKQQNLI